MGPLTVSARDAFLSYALAGQQGQGRVGWHKNNNVGEIFLIRNAKEANARIGNCWMKNRLRRDDLVLCVAHTGDGFHDYILLEKGGNFIRALMGSRFGAYGIQGGKKVATLEEADFVELVSSDRTELVAPLSFRSVAEAQRGEHLQKLVASF